MKSGRDRMLSNIRAALAGGPPIPSLDEADDALGLPVSGSAAQFAESLCALNANFLEAANPAEARALIDTMLENHGYVASPARIVEACGFTPNFSREAAAEADFGISSADFALADTGSLVFLSESRESRLISLLPPHHIVLIQPGQILPGLPELFARLPHPAANSSSMVIVTGPSRTGDIEMRLVRGVHGPGQMTVIMILEDVTRS